MRETIFVCKDTKLATFACPYCSAHVHRGEFRCANCGRDVQLMAQQLWWGPILYNQALAYVQKGLYERALPLLHKARVLMPERREPYVLLGKLEAYRGRYGSAESWFTDAHELGLLDREELDAYRAALGTLAEQRPSLVRHGLLSPLRRLATMFQRTPPATDEPAPPAAHGEELSHAGARRDP